MLCILLKSIFKEDLIINFFLNYYIFKDESSYLDYMVKKFILKYEIINLLHLYIFKWNASSVSYLSYTFG